MARSRRTFDRLPWFAGALVVALMPKCLGCLAVYAELGALFGVGFGAPALCGAHPGTHGPATIALALAGAGVAMGGWLRYRRRRRETAGAPAASEFNPSG